MTYELTHVLATRKGGYDLTVEPISYTPDKTLKPLPHPVFDMLADVLRSRGYTVEEPYSDPELRTGDLIAPANGDVAQWVYVPIGGVGSYDFIPIDRDGFRISISLRRDELPKKIKKLERPSEH